MMPRPSHREPATALEKLEAALATASVDQLATAIPGYFDGDDIVKLIGLLQGDMRQPV